MIYKFVSLLVVWRAPCVSSFSAAAAAAAAAAAFSLGGGGGQHSESSMRAPSGYKMKSKLFSSSYLDSLSASIPAKEEEEIALTAETIGPLPVSEGEEELLLPPFAHASIGYFALDQLAIKDPRATADVGEPQEATRPIMPSGKQYHEGKMLTAGSWFCTEGGWPSPSPKAHTEVFYVLSGHCSMNDADGTQHYFGPGDTVIIPKGHTGRWDIYQPIHKVWTSHHHSKIENTDPRVQVIPYYALTPSSVASAASSADTLYGTKSSAVSCQTFYDIGPTKVGAWNCIAPTSFSVHDTKKSIFFHLLEGTMYISDAQTGHARRCIPGDTVLLPAHWSGYIDILQPVKKMFTTAATPKPKKPPIMEWTPGLNHKF